MKRRKTMNRRKVLTGFAVIIILGLGYLLYEFRDQVDWMKFGQFVLLIIVMYGILRFATYYRYKRLEEYLNQEDYETVLFRVKNLFRLNLFPNLTDQRLCLRVSLLFLKNDDRKNFLRYINKLDYPTIVWQKYFWRAILHFRENSIEKAKRNIQQFEEVKTSIDNQTVYETYCNILEGLKRLIQEKDWDHSSIDINQLKVIDPLAVTLIKDTISLVETRKKESK